MLDAKDMYELIKTARTAYRRSNVKLTVPQPQYEPSGPDYIRLSALGLCVDQHGYEKLNVKPDYPRLTLEENEEKNWITDHGSYVAPMVQEPLMWLAMTTPGITFWPEKPYLSDELHLSGRLDGLLEVDGVQYVLEIKDAEGQQSRSVGEPRPQYGLQTLGGQMMSNVRRGFIIIVSKWSWNVYQLREEYDQHYLIYNERNEVWTPPKWVKNFNSPDFLNYGTVKQVVADAQQAIASIAQAGTAPPPFDALNDPLSWQCFWHFDKPRAYKNGNSSDGEGRVNCPWAKRCQGLEDRVYKTRKTEEGYEFTE
jgi:hypothetical protein